MVTSQLKKFYSILKQYIFPWWLSEEKKMAWSGLLGLLLLSLVSVYIAVIFNEWTRNFYNAIEKKDLTNFLHQILIFIPLVGILLFDFCCRSYLTAWFSFRWRHWSTEKLQEQWLAHKNFYKIPLRSKEIDNPDQRISQDVSQVCYTTIEIFISFFREGINFVTFAIILWSLSRDFVFNIAGHQLHFPGLLVWASVAYALVGTVMTFKIGGPIIDLDRVQEKREANFRYRLMRIFERREEIATLGGECVEHQGLLASFAELTKNYYEVLKRKIYINLFENFYRNAGMFVPLFLVGALYFKSLITMGVLMQSQGMFAQVNGSLSSIIGSFQSIASSVASLQRLMHFNSMMEKKEDETNFLATTEEQLHIPSLTIQTPQQEKIWISPEVILKKGDCKILMAPSGTGKTSFLRAIAGIYPYVEEGALAMKENFMIVPQRPYMPLGTLRQCLYYPSSTWSNDDELVQLMKEVGLGHLIKLLDQVYDYQNRLSLGEQQRINFVRALLHQPTWLFMDEPIAHLPKKCADSLLVLLTKNLPQSGIFIVSHQELDGFEEVDLYH